MNAVGLPLLGIEAAHLIGIAPWAPAHWLPSQVSLERSGYRLQVVSGVAGALEPALFRKITIHAGMHSVKYILEAPISSDHVPDRFCRDFLRLSI